MSNIRVLVSSSVLGNVAFSHLASLMTYHLCSVLPDHPAGSTVVYVTSLHYNSWVRNWHQTARNLHENCAGCTLLCVYSSLYLSFSRQHSLPYMHASLLNSLLNSLRTHLTLESKIKLHIYPLHIV